MLIIKSLFWIALFLVFYTYFGYPLLLIVLNELKKEKNDSKKPDQGIYPQISFLVPVHNEGYVISDKIKNCLALDYPPNKIEFLFISDGSTDRTNSIIAENSRENLRLITMNERGGKARALNKGLEASKGEIIIFSDVSIILEKDSLKAIVLPFRNKAIGCVSGEDQIREAEGEGFYGRYELFLRNRESKLFSIVGASGSFYAQRRELCILFPEGLAPDFLSVLNTVEQGYRAITEPTAIGYMTSLKDTRDEFNRKVRTLVRGMSALFYKKQLLNPIHYPLFAFELISHKLLRWLVPFFLGAILITSILLLNEEFYFFVFCINIVFYSFAILAGKKIWNLHEKLLGKIPLFFTIVNGSILLAWFKYIMGFRQELWMPTKRNSML